MTTSPDTYGKYESGHRDPELVAAMAIIDQMEETNRYLGAIARDLERLADEHGRNP